MSTIKKECVKLKALIKALVCHIMWHYTVIASSLSNIYDIQM